MLCSENVLQEHHTKNCKESKNVIENEKGWKKNNDKQERWVWADHNWLPSW